MYEFNAGLTYAFSPQARLSAISSVPLNLYYQSNFRIMSHTVESFGHFGVSQEQQKLAAAHLELANQYIIPEDPGLERRV